jgi:hypothetical protein
MRSEACVFVLALSCIGCRTPPCEQPAEPGHVTDPLACRPDTPEHEAAQVRLDALDQRIEALHFDDPVGPLEVALAELRASRCFERSVEHSELIKLESSAALREWWLRGGRTWLRFYLRLPAPGDTIVLPPTPRRVLYAEASRAAPIARLACPYQPAEALTSASLAPWLELEECGSDTVVWLENAHQAHEYWALWSANWQAPALAARWRSLTADGDSLRVNPVGERCSHSIEHDLLPSYARWRACVEAERGRMSMLPAGAFRQPEHGWLITNFIAFTVDDGCSKYTAYHLDTGAAHWGKRCEDGSSERHSGTVPADRVREALLLSMLAEYAVDGAPFADAVRAPDGLPILWPEGARPLRWREPTLGVQIDHETTVRYRWWDREIIAEGRVDGPYHGTGAEAHARSLHFDLQASRREGSAPIELPDELWASFAREPKP